MEGKKFVRTSGRTRGKGWGLLLLLVIMIPANAQVKGLLHSIDEKEVFFGINSSTLRNIRFPEYNTLKIGYLAGVGVTWQLTEKAAIKVGLQAERNGIKRVYESYYFDEDEQQQRGSVNEVLNLDYVKLPAVVRYSIDSDGKFSADLGGYISLLHKAQSSTELSWRAGRDVYDKRDSYTNYDAGLSLGVAYSHGLGENYSLRCRLGLNYGLVDVGKQSNQSAFHMVSNSSLNLGLSLVKK